MRRAAAVARWVARATGPALAAHLVPRTVALLLVAVEADAMAPLPAVSRALQALPVWTAALAFAGVALLQALSERAAVADLLLGPRHAVLRRQPIDGPTFGPAAAAVLGPLGLPVAALGLLWSGSPATALLWLALWLPLAVLAARPAWLPAAVLPGAAVAALAAALPALALPLLAAAVALAVPAAGALALALAAGPAAAPGGAGRRPRTRFGALLAQDLRVLRRGDPALVRSALAGALVAAPLALMRAFGRWDARALTAAAIVLLALVGPLALAWPAAVARRLGRRLDPPEWPVPALERALALTALGGLALAPGWASAAVAAPAIGVGHLRIGGFVLALAAGAAWWVAARPGRPNAGTFPWWIALCLLAALAPLPAAVPLALLALWRAARALERRRW